MRANPSLRLLFVLGLLVGGVASASALCLDLSIPLNWLVVAIGLITVWGLGTTRLTELSLLPRLMILLFALPYSTTVGYLAASDYLWWHTPLSIQIMLDKRVAEVMLILGVVGLCGLIAGLQLAGLVPVSRRRHRDVMDRGMTRERTLRPLPFAFLLLNSVLFSWVSAPSATIFDAPYAAEGTASLASSMNFGSAYLLSYVLLILLYVDAEAERGDRRTRSRKRAAVLVVTAFIIVFFQLLRGDRESSGLIAALLALWVTGDDESARRTRVSVKTRRLILAALPVALLVLVFLTLGAARSELSLGQRGASGPLQLVAAGAQSHTWTAVLLTNLGISAEYVDGRMEYLFGRTYLDYALSLPPGIVTSALGMQRPLEATQGPNWWFGTLTAGGIHAVVVPFKNFGVFGVMAILAFYGYIIGRVELASADPSLWNRLRYGTLIAASFLWFWYGDMNVIRAVMACALAYAAHQLLVRFRLVTLSVSPLDAMEPQTPR